MQNRFNAGETSEDEVVVVSSGLIDPPSEPTATTKPKRTRTRKPKTPAPQPAPTPEPQPAPEVTPAPAAHVSGSAGWAKFGVAFMACLSALLNGYANAQHSPIAVFGWLMGLAIPVIVLTLAKVAGEKFKVGQKLVARFAGGSGIALLFLSVWHCSQAIALITGSPVALALPLAIAIDAGLVACEAALITEPTK